MANRVDGRADKRLPVHEDTFELLREQKPRGASWDRYLRRLADIEPPIE